MHEAYKKWSFDIDTVPLKKRQFQRFLLDHGLSEERDNHSKVGYQLNRLKVENAIQLFTKTTAFTCEQLLEGAQAIVSEAGQFVKEMEAIRHTRTAMEATS